MPVMGGMDLDLEELLGMFAANPALTEGLATMSIFDPKSQLLGKRADRAEWLQRTPGATGQSVGGGYVASSPLEHLGVAMNRIQGGQQARDIGGQQDAMLQGDVGTRQALVKAMLRAMQGGQGGEDAGSGMLPGVI